MSPGFTRIYSSKDFGKESFSLFCEKAMTEYKRIYMYMSFFNECLKIKCKYNGFSKTKTSPFNVRGLNATAREFVLN